MKNKSIILLILIALQGEVFANTEMTLLESCEYKVDQAIKVVEKNEVTKRYNLLIAQRDKLQSENLGKRYLDNSGIYDMAKKDVQKVYRNIHKVEEEIFTRMGSINDVCKVNLEKAVDVDFKADCVFRIASNPSFSHRLVHLQYSAEACAKPLSSEIPVELSAYNQFLEIYTKNNMVNR